MTGIVIQNTAVNPGGEPLANEWVHIALVTGTPGGAGYTASGDILEAYTVRTDATGHWSATLTPNSQITPANTYYQAIEGSAVSDFTVPDTGGPYNLSERIVTSPPTPAAPGITGVEVAANGTVAGSQPEVNLIAGTGMILSAVDNPTSGRVDVTLESTGGAPVSSVNGQTGAVVLTAADVNAVPTSAEGAANGVATLDASSHIPAAQGANFYSRQIEIACNGPSSTVVATVGTWTPMFLTNAQTGNFVGWVNQSDGLVNDSISFDFECGAGVYSLELHYLPFTNRGIYTVEIDGVTVGTIDGYAASLSPQRAVLTGISIAAAGQHTVTLLMATKNPSSTSYIGMVERILLTRTS